MKEYRTDQIRNVVLLGHGGTGKTSLAEAALFSSGGTTRLGRVDDGTTASDFEPDEVKRRSASAWHSSPASGRTTRSTSSTRPATPISSAK